MKPAPCTPEESAARAKAKAHAEDLTLATWIAMARTAGVERVRFEITPEGIKIGLRGTFDRRTQSLDVIAPTEQPFVLHAVAALEAFRSGTVEAPAAPAKRPNPTSIHKDPPQGAGARKALGLPLCKQCEAQPVYQLHAEFCGAECAKAWFTANAASAVRASRR